MTRIAAVVTNRDLGTMLLEAVDSLERQTRRPDEIVVVDDRSTDEHTRLILMGLRDRGLTVVEGPGRGASAARNLGASMTTAEYLVWLDGDDTLEPGYFEAAAARLDADASLDFVTTAMRAFGESSFVWAPAIPTFVEAVATGGVPHASTLIRRRVWQDTGGFDEGVPSFELLDFWASALERGFRGVVLDQPFINYRIRRDSGYRRSIQQDTYLSRMRHFYAKHRAAVDAHGIELLKGKEAFFISQRNYWRGLEARASSLESELHALRRGIEDASRALESRGVPRSESSALVRERPKHSPSSGARPASAATGRAARPPARARAAIVAYHRIANLTPDSHHLCTPPDVFHEHMKYVRTHLRPIALDELLADAANGSVADGAVAVTFDDGYVDGLENASPILSDLGIPATFFVNSDRLSEPHERWWDVLERIFLIEPALPATLAIAVDGRRIVMPLATAAERSAALDAINRMMWPMDARGRAAMFDAILAWSGLSAPPRATHRVVTGDELRELAARPGHSIGAHTTHHLALTTQSADTKRREIGDDKAALERVIDRPIPLFAYPYGDLDGETVAVVRDAGFRAAVTIEDGVVAAGTNRLLLPRFEITPARHGDFPSLLQQIFRG